MAMTKFTSMSFHVEYLSPLSLPDPLDADLVGSLAVEHAIETTSVGNMPCEIHKHESLAQSNPYHLPWIMRGLLEEDFVKTELSSETAELLEKFDEWKPVNKALKDVKYRLEAVRSKL